MRDLTKAEIEAAIQATLSMTSAAKKLGVGYYVFKRYAKKYNVFATNKSGKGLVKLKFKHDVFIEGKHQTRSVLLQRLKHERELKCEVCGLTEWRGRIVKLELHHVDGNNTNNRRENLQLLCPNCHSITETWRSNLKSKLTKVSDIELKEALKEESNIRRALIKVGLSPKGGNYSRAYQLLSELSSA